MHRRTEKEIIVFEGSFFGRTYGSKIATVDGSKIYDLVIRVIPFNSIKALETAVNDSTLAISLELILGHGGIKIIDPKIIKKIKILASKRNIIIHVDEVQTGLGRCGSPFLCQEFNLNPDIITIGKSLGGGIPLSAVLVSEKVSESIRPGEYGSTMGGNSLACAAGVQVVNFIKSEKNLSIVRDKGLCLKDFLSILAEKYETIVDIRCYVLMCGIEVRNEATAHYIVENCMAKGLLVDIVNNTVIRMLPPLTVSFKEIDRAIKILESSLEDYTYDL